MHLAETTVPPVYSVSDDGETIAVSSDFRYVNEQWSSDGDLIPGNVPGRVTETKVSDLQLITNTADGATLWDLRTSESRREIGFASGVVREAHRVPGTATAVILIEGGQYSCGTPKRIRLNRSETPTGWRSTATLTRTAAVRPSRLPLANVSFWTRQRDQRNASCVTTGGLWRWISATMAGKS